MVIHVNQIPKGLRRLWFWRKSIKPDKSLGEMNQSKEQIPERISVVLDLPRDKVAKGVCFYITEDGPEEIEHFSVLAKLDRHLDISFDPYVCYNGKTYWTITFRVSYYDGRTNYGSIGEQIVDEIGLQFPNEATPYADGIKHKEGRVTWKTNWLPEPYQIREVIQEVDRQITGLMKAYAIAKGIDRVIERGKK